MKLLRIAAVARKESMHILRDWRTLGILVMLPLILLLLFGYAIDLDVTDIRLAVHDADRSPESRRTVEQFENSGYFTLTARIDSPDEAQQLLDSEQIDAFLGIPTDFSRSILRGETAHVHASIDGANPQIGANIVGLIEATTADLHVAGGSPVRSRIWYNPALESAHFLVPGLIAMILVITAVVSTAVGVSRERESGSMEQLRVSPLRPMEFILGKCAPYALVSALVAALVIVLGTQLFGVPVAGSLLALGVSTVLFLVACLGLGLLIASIAKTQQVAFMMAVLVTFLPTFLLSGFVFPIRNMPVPIQNVSRIVPARYYLEALRRILLKGGSFEIVTTELTLLIAFAFLTGALALYRLRRIVGTVPGRRT